MKYIELVSARYNALQDFYDLVLPYMEKDYPRIKENQIMNQIKIKGIRGFLKFYNKIKLDDYDKKKLQEMMIEEENKAPQPSTPFLKYLQWRFDFFNKKFFHNRLSQIPFEVYNNPIYGAVAAFYNKKGDKNIKYAKYLFCKKIFQSKAYTDIVLLHEMCHQAVFELDKKLISGKNAHNENWKHYMTLVGLTPPEMFQETISNIERIPNWKNLDGKELFKAIREKKASVSRHNARIRNLMAMNKETAIDDLMKQFEPAIKVLYKSYKAAGKVASISQLKALFKSKMEISIENVFKYFNPTIREQLQQERQIRRILIAEKHNWNVTGLYPQIDKKLGFA